MVVIKTKTEEMICRKTIFLNHNNPLKMDDINDCKAKNGNMQPKIFMYKLYEVSRKTKKLSGSENSIIKTPKETDNIKKSQKNVEITAEASFLLSLFSTNNLINDCENPLVDNDLKRDVKFLKLPVKAIPGVPK